MQLVMRGKFAVRPGVKGSFYWPWLVKVIVVLIGEY